MKLSITITAEEQPETVNRLLKEPADRTCILEYLAQLISAGAPGAKLKLTSKHTIELEPNVRTLFDEPLVLELGR